MGECTHEVVAHWEVVGPWIRGPLINGISPAVWSRNCCERSVVRCEKWVRRPHVCVGMSARGQELFISRKKTLCYLSKSKGLASVHLLVCTTCPRSLRKGSRTTTTLRDVAFRLPPFSCRNLLVLRCSSTEYAYAMRLGASRAFYEAGSSQAWLLRTDLHDASADGTRGVNGGVNEWCMFVTLLGQCPRCITHLT